MAVAVNDVFAAALEMKFNGQQVYNTLALRVTAVPANTTEEVWTDTYFGTGAFYNNPLANFLLAHRGCCTSDVSYLAWHVRRADPNPTQPLLRPVSAGTSGSLVPPSLPQNVAASISRVGTAAGRRNRGRIALAGAPQVEAQAGKWSAQQLVRMALLGFLLTGTTAGGAGYSAQVGYWVPAHTGIKNGQPVNYPALFVPCVAYIARDTVRVQRSRTVGVGK